MRWPRWLAGLVILASACSSETLYEVEGYLGVMDCPNEYWAHSIPEIPDDAPGSPTPEEALALLTSGLGRPPGTPQVESQSPEGVVYLFTDPDGHRLGRASVFLWQTGGWLVGVTERCG